MAHKFDLDFSKKLVSCEGPNILGVRCHGSPLTDMCFTFDLGSASSGTTKTVSVIPVENKKQPWLYGPATDIASKRVIYPCTRYKCSLPCPCLRCRKVHPRCRINSSNKSCNCSECYEFFFDHEKHHLVPHLGCRACHRLTTIFPNFNYFFFNIKKDEPEHDHELGTWLVDVDRECCGDSKIIYPDLDDLRQHILKKHNVISLFRHRYQNFRDKTEQLKCFQCKETFATIKQLNRHVDAKHFGTSFDCDKCGSIFSREDTLLRHIRSRHQDTRYGDALARHAKEQHEVETVQKLECKKCKRVFSQKRNYQRHLDTSVKDGVHKYKCDECAMSFCTQTILKKHIEVDHSDRSDIGRLECERCPVWFDSESELKIHIEMCHSLETFKCDRCEKSFSRKDNLERHSRVNHKVSEKNYIFKCPICASTFRKKSSFQRHRGDHTRYPLQFSCEDCPDKFFPDEALRMHIESHKVSAVQKFECCKCDKVFTQEKNFKRHVENSVEDGIDKYSCDQCKRSFCTKTSLTYHMEFKHKEGFGKFRCHKCSLNYNSKSLLLVHYEHVHCSEEFQCDSCEKSFSRVEHLKRHKVTHKSSDGTRSDFQCSLCGSDFAWKTNYQRHMKGIYKSDGSFKNHCLVCGKDFCTSKFLKAHTDSQHI